MDSNPESRSGSGQGLDIEAILAVLPHRYPFLLVDRVLELEPGRRCLGLKNVTANESFFVGHFPQHPLMPGVLILEALAQVGGIMILTHDAYRGKMAYLAGVDRARFRRRVVPGDRLLLETELLRQKGSFGFVRAVAQVDGQVAAEAEVFFAIGEQQAPEGRDRPAPAGR